MQRSRSQELSMIAEPIFLYHKKRPPAELVSLRENNSVENGFAIMKRTHILLANQEERYQTRPSVDKITLPAVSQ